MVQDPKSAKFDGMPNSAIKTGLADYILPPEEMPYQLIRYTSQKVKGILSDKIINEGKIPDTFQNIYSSKDTHGARFFTLQTKYNLPTRGKKNEYLSIG